VAGHEIDELLDVLDEQGRPTGISKPRGRVHRDGDWHRSLQLWVLRGDGHVLLQRRATQKDLEGGRIDVTVGGHYRSGETLPEVLREAREEIGLELEPQDLHQLLTRRVERFYPKVVDREFQEVYVLRCDHPLTYYQLDCREVFALYQAPLTRVIELYRAGRYLPAAGMDCQQRENNALLVEDDLISQGREDTVVALRAALDWLRRQGDRR